MSLSRKLLATLAVLLCAACGDAADTGGETQEAVTYSDAAPEPAPAVAPMEPPSRRSGVEQGLAGAGEPQPAPAQGDTTVVQAMLIRTGSATVEVDSLEPAIARVRQLAERVGGLVGNTTIRTGERQARQATLQLRVPAARFDEALQGLEPLGEVEEVNVSAEDVGEEFVDVSARLANARRLEERLMELLRTRTGSLEDVLAVERELARVREQIERFEGRLRYLRTRVAVSTLTVNLHEPYPVVGDYPGENPIAGAFRQGWRNFVGFMAAFIASLGILVPLGAIVAVVWLVARRVRGRGKRNPPPPAGRAEP